MATALLCPRCRDAERLPGVSYCRPCQTAYQRAWRAGEVEPKKRTDGLCPRCGERPRGEQGYCKTCSTEAYAEWRAQNRERANETSKRWRDANPEKVKASKKRGARRQILRRYGITEERYAELLVLQGGGCAICAEPPVEEVLHVDHDHTTGVVRGLLCRRCNTALGQMMDSPERLMAAAAYLLERRGI